MGGGQVKNEGVEKGVPKPYCELGFRSECKWCHMCDCSPFQVIRHILKFVNWLNSSGNNLVLHKPCPQRFNLQN